MYKSHSIQKHRPSQQSHRTIISAKFKDIATSQWLTCLAYDLKKAGQNPPSPELFLEAIEMLLEGGPAKRLDSTPGVRKIVENSSSGSDSSAESWLDIAQIVDVCLRGLAHWNSSYSPRCVSAWRVGLVQCLLLCFAVAPMRTCLHCNRPMDGIARCTVPMKLWLLIYHGQ
ncbi:uncharacterized protein K444DRAFT_344967 [Hyaloscypha bicolor E]|uniref:Uncharacterized protein n=1 Tax=Hyaloscypha bicolor E TaxID=1095630 RepID=A0A2J6THS4_9HELO|nr:uncharacterized protein K444DRAFT_344967 [Hyaloscypha bicolor E]PMD62563.1 hypothetical protein K444DRAFT_344967 [Hyaloscypha bicolor E]